MPPKPSESVCDWCGSTAKVCTEIKVKVSKGTLGTGQYMGDTPGATVGGAGLFLGQPRVAG